MKIKVIGYEWNGKGCYLGVMQYKDISKLINIEGNRAKNRDIDEKKVSQIVTYIKTERRKAFFPPVILNSSAKFTIDNDELNVANHSLIIIDGQHRLNAICNLLKEEENEDIKSKEIPFLLIEGVENQEHRDLFRLINDMTKNVEATVSARFEPTLSNYLGLRIVSEDLKSSSQVKLKNHIEWEKKQSEDKICYLFITDINKLFLGYIDKNITEKNEEESYQVLKRFWMKYFEHVLALEEDSIERAFYIKKVVIKAIAKHIIECWEKGTESTDKYSSMINCCESELQKVLKDVIDIQEYQNEYGGSYRQISNTYVLIIRFLLGEAPLNQSILEENQEQGSTLKEEK